jgi:polysaccharide export outer membrane protein
MRRLAGLLLLLLAAGVAGASEYLLGPGDVLKIGVYQNPDLATEARVSESGTITFPLIGTIRVAGDSAAAAISSSSRR